MPYGFGGGLAAGFDSGLGHGINMAELRMRREALLKEQIDEKLKLFSALQDKQLENITNTVTKAGQRDPNLESTVAAMVDQGQDLIGMMESLGTPEAVQVAKHYRSLYQNVDKLQTMAEAHTQAEIGKTAGSVAYAQQAPGIVAGMTGGQQPTPGVTMTGTPPTDPNVLRTNEASQPGQVAQVAQTGPAPAPAAPPAIDIGTPQQLFDEARGRTGKSGKGGSEIPADAIGRLSQLNTGLADLANPVDPQDPSKGTLLDIMATPSKWNIGQAAGLPGRLAGDELGRAKSAMQTSISGIIYMLSGAAINEKEEVRLFDSYMPAWGDTDQQAKEKIQRLFQFKGRAEQIYRDRGGEPISKEQALQLAGMRFEDVAPPPGQQVAGEGMGSSATAAPAAPAVGTVEDGYRFKGGNPADPNSWEQVQ